MHLSPEIDEKLWEQSELARSELTEKLADIDNEVDFTFIISWDFCLHLQIFFCHPDFELELHISFGFGHIVQSSSYNTI